MSQPDTWHDATVDLRALVFNSISLLSYVKVDKATVTMNSSWQIILKCVSVPTLGVPILWRCWTLWFCYRDQADFGVHGFCEKTSRPEDKKQAEIFLPVLRTKAEVNKSARI